MFFIFNNKFFNDLFKFIRNMAEKFKGLFRIPSIRLQNWDYGWNAPYFVTICTKYRACFFGKIINNKMQLSDVGIIAQKFWLEIPEHFPFVSLDEFVVMPNHVHGIVIINKPKITQNIDFYINKIPNRWGCEMGDATVETRQCLVSTTTPTDQTEKSNTINNIKTGSNNPHSKKNIGQKRFQNQGKGTLSSIIGSYKSVVTKNARIKCLKFSWQSRFHDHIIRNDAEFKRIVQYIKYNPNKWNNDKFYMQP